MSSNIPTEVAIGPTGPWLTYKCDSCGRPFKRYAVLKRHVCVQKQQQLSKDALAFKVATRNWPYRCHVCGHSFINGREMVVHMKQQHWRNGGREPCVCRICLKAGWIRVPLEELQSGGEPNEARSSGHSDEESSGEPDEVPREQQPHASSDRRRVHQCLVCGKALASKTNLVVHIRQHTGERPFECGKCDKAYASRGGLRKHMTTKHADATLGRQATSSAGREPRPAEIVPAGYDNPVASVLTEDESVVRVLLKNQQVISVPVRKKPVFVVPTDETAGAGVSMFMAVVPDTSFQAPTPSRVVPATADDQSPVFEGTATEFLKSWRPDGLAAAGSHTADDDGDGERVAAIERDIENFIATAEETTAGDDPAEETAAGDGSEKQTAAGDGPAEQTAAGDSLAKETAMNVEWPELMEWTREYVETTGELNDFLEQVCRDELLAPDSVTCDVDKLVPTLPCALNPSSPPRRKMVLREQVLVKDSVTGETWYRCSVCDKMLKQLISLRRHMTRHGYEAPRPQPPREYPCTLCPMKLYSRDAYRKHTKTSHPRMQQLRTPIACPLCQVPMCNKHSLIRHSRVKHGFTSSPCPACSIPAMYLDVFNKYLGAHTNKCPKIRERFLLIPQADMAASPPTASSTVEKHSPSAEEVPSPSAAKKPPPSAANSPVVDID